MSRDRLRKIILDYFKSKSKPMGLIEVAEELRNTQKALKSLPDSAFRDIIQPMIMVGRLSFTPELKIKISQEKR